MPHIYKHAAANACACVSKNILSAEWLAGSASSAARVCLSGGLVAGETDSATEEIVLPIEDVNRWYLSKQ
jgi:hypothetical protein